VYQLMRYGGMIALGICLAKVLPQDVIGKFETFLLISGMFTFFWVSGIINSMLAALPKKPETEQKLYIYNTFITLVVCSFFAAALLSLFAKNVLELMHNTANTGLVGLAIAFIVVNSPSFITEYILYLNNQTRLLIVYGISMAVITVCAAFVPAAMGMHIEYSMAALCGVGVIKLIYAMVMLGRYATPKLNRPMIQENLKQAWPLIGSIFVSGSAEYIDGFIVKAKFDDATFTIYRYGAKELPILLIMANTLSTGMIKPIAENLEKGMEELKAASTRLMHIFFPISIVLMLCSTFLFKKVYTDAFAFSALIFNIYLLLAIPRVLFPQTILTALQKNKVVLVSSMLEIVINVSASLYLSTIFGLAGIALGTLIAYVFDKVFLVLYMWGVVGVSPGRYLHKGWYLVYGTALLLAFFAAYYALGG
jgi:O-antigen/teichoic acid export membrane protein